MRTKTGPPPCISSSNWDNSTVFIHELTESRSRTMASANGDRNLLFGILALQMDFIGRDALIAAMNAWVLEKSKTLGHILLEQEALAPDTHALLEALVQKHLALHGNDAEKSLATV